MPQLPLLSIDDMLARILALIDETKQHPDASESVRRLLHVAAIGVRRVVSIRRAGQETPAQTRQRINRALSAPRDLPSFPPPSADTRDYRERQLPTGDV